MIFSTAWMIFSDSFAEILPFVLHFHCNKSSLVQAMAWCHTQNTPLTGPYLTQLTYIYYRHPGFNKLSRQLKDRLVWSRYQTWAIHWDLSLASGRFPADFRRWTWFPFQSARWNFLKMNTDHPNLDIRPAIKCVYSIHTWLLWPLSPEFSK